MALPQLFRTYRHKIFNYTPLYYNKEKDELESRIKSAEAEAHAELKHGDSTMYRSSITRGSMRGYLKQNKRAKKQSNIRLLIIILLLLIITYYLFIR